MHTEKSQYTNIAKLLHWLVAALIVSQYGLAKLAEIAQDNDQALNQLAILANHKSIGITILILALIRLAYRLFRPPPALPHSMPHWQKLASNLSHCFLYGFLFALPISGWLMSSAKAFAVSWFNLFAIPDLVHPSESLAEQLLTVHHYLADALVIIAGLHVIAALKHHLLDKDDVLSRMADKLNFVIFVVITASAFVFFGRLITANSAISPPTTQNTQSVTLTSSALPTWSINYADSYIKFSGNQAGAPFHGQWQDWSANIQFDSEHLSASRFNVEINSASAHSNDDDRDKTMRSSEFFDVDQFSSSQYLAQDFSETDNGFIANGYLTMKGLSNPTVLDFTVVELEDTQVLTGSAKIDRLVWNIGTGDWSDTSWIGQQVNVEVRVVRTLEN